MKEKNNLIKTANNNWIINNNTLCPILIKNGDEDIVKSLKVLLDGSEDSNEQAEKVSELLSRYNLQFQFPPGDSGPDISYIDFPEYSETGELAESLMSIYSAGFFIMRSITQLSSAGIDLVAFHSHHKYPCPACTILLDKTYSISGKDPQHSKIPVPCPPCLEDCMLYVVPAT